MGDRNLPPADGVRKATHRGGGGGGGSQGASRGRTGPPALQPGPLCCLYTGPNEEKKNLAENAVPAANNDGNVQKATGTWLEAQLRTGRKKY